MTATSAADLILHGGRVHTVDEDRPTAEAVAVLGGRIVAVGSDADVLALAGSRTRRIDLHGRTLLPGFQDAHVHAVTSGLDRLRCDLTEVEGAAGYLTAIAAYAAAHPERPAILGGGWDMAAFPRGTPDRALLDAIVPDRPVALDNRDGHGTWVNSKALELAGLDDDAPDPPRGRIEREVDGRSKARSTRAPPMSSGMSFRSPIPRSGWKRRGSGSASCTRTASPPGRMPAATRTISSPIDDSPKRAS